MTITYVIPGATELNQLDPTTLDGLPANDANDDCVPTSLAEGLHILTGKTYDGDELKDAVYGAGYVGTMAASAYVSYCHGQGVALTSFTSSSQADLVSEIHAQVSAGHPVIVTMPSQWGTAPADPMNPGSSHVGCAVGVGDGYIRVMNPWGGFWQDEPDDWWAARLCYGQVWPMEKVGATTMPTAGDATPFFGLVYTADPEVWHCPATGFDLGHGFLAFYQGVSGPGHQSGTQILGLPKSNESSANGLVKQQFERGRLVYDQSKADPWQITLDNISDELAELAAAEAAQAQTQANLTAALGQRDALSSQLAAAQAQEAASQAEVTTLQQQLAAAQAQIASGPPAAPPAPSPLEAAAVQLAPALKAFLAAANALT